MRKEIILPTLAVVGGGVGFALRRWELATVFEPVTGLARAGMPATYALVGLSVVMALALAVLCRIKGDHLPEDHDAAFAAKGNTVYITAMVCAAFLIAAGGALTLLNMPDALAEAKALAEARRGGSPYLAVAPRLLLGALALLSGGSLFQVGRSSYQGQDRGRYDRALLVPAYACCLWLIVTYQANSGDSVTLSYVWELLAVAAAVLGSYYMAGFGFERGKPGRAAWCSLVCVYLCLVTLADGHELAQLLLYVGFGLYSLASAAALLFNCGRPQGPRMPRPEAGDPANEMTNREGNPDEG